MNAFYEQQAGTTQEVLFEKEDKNGWMFGYSRNYVKVMAPAGAELRNKVVELILKDRSPEGHYLYC